MVRLDIEYGQRLNLWLDLQILFKTVPALWGQYCDLRLAKSQVPIRSRSNTTKSAESFSL